MILAELLIGKPFLEGKDEMAQVSFSQILN